MPATGLTVAALLLRAVGSIPYKTIVCVIHKLLFKMRVTLFPLLVCLFTLEIGAMAFKDCCQKKEVVSCNKK